MLDADVRGFFDAISHGWLVKFIEHRIADKRVLRLIQKWLNAGVVEDGTWMECEEGTPQGATERRTREEPSIDARRRDGWARGSDEAW